MKQVGISRFTEYRSPCLKNEEMKKQIGSDSPLVYKMYLQKNANNIIKNNLKTAYKNNSLECKCKACVGTCKVCGMSVNLMDKK